jgi:RNA polymerase sigma factor (TIGR02999 family)
MLETHYSMLRGLASRILAQRREQQRNSGADRISPTSLVAEATLRLLLQRTEIRDGEHLEGLAALSMQRSISDRARKRLAKRRTPPKDIATVAKAASPAEPDDTLRTALESLQRSNPRQAEMVTLVGLQGATVAQAAKALGISVPTAERDLRAARLWLSKRLRGE